MIIDGEMDEYPENAFFNVGSIDEVSRKSKNSGTVRSEAYAEYIRS